MVDFLLERDWLRALSEGSRQHHYDPKARRRTHTHATETPTPTVLYGEFISVSNKMSNGLNHPVPSNLLWMEALKLYDTESCYS